MKRIIQKFGNVCGVCIPQEIKRDLRLNQGNLLDFSVENGKIILTPVHPSAKMNEQETEQASINIGIDQHVRKQRL